MEVDDMRIGFIGLGRMGKNMVNRMLMNSMEVVAYDKSEEAIDDVVSQGAEGVGSVKECIDTLETGKRVIWMMLPAGEVTENVFQEALALLERGDILIDGANSNFHDTMRRHKQAEDAGVGMLDVGVSGGIIAAERGYPMMVGGEEEVYERCRPIFDALGIDEGYDLVGGPAAGHYVKMVHNAIEYGMMQAIAEGFDLLRNGRMEGLDLRKVAHVWNHGTIISSFLMDMTEKALDKDQGLSYLKAQVDDSGEGRWAATEALEHAVPFVTNTYALHARFASRDEDSYALRLLAAMREQFGGHPVHR